MLSIIGYILSVMAANFTATWFVSFGFFTTAVGTFFFGATFTLRDYIHTHYGKPTVINVILLTVALSVLQSVFLDVPVRVIIASAVAMILAELTDTQIFHMLRKRSWFMRVVSSNAVSVPVDTLLFNAIAFIVLTETGLMAQLGPDLVPLVVLLSVVVTETFVKWGIGLFIAAPKTVFVRA